jgi:hypothetical protein
MRLIRVLNHFGLGSFTSVLVAVTALIQAKQPDDRLIVNLSLGMLPPFEQLPDTWFGFPIEGLPGCPPNVDMQVLADGTRLTREDMREQLKRDKSPVNEALAMLEAPMQQLMVALEAHNCLVVAAAGNDSVSHGIDRRPRWKPRVPACYDQTLGVAATSIQAQSAARYSNRGDLESPPEPVRDAVATFGGDLDSDGVSPSAGVIGVYSSKRFPPVLPPAPRPRNLTGWAEWSGTSFATPIMSGIAANFWATYPGCAQDTLANLNAAVRFGTSDVPDLEVPPVPVSLTWLP